MIKEVLAALSRQDLKIWAPLAILAMILVLYAVPLIGLGLEDLNAVQHLNPDEYYIIDAWLGVYSQGPFYGGPFKVDFVYPKAFYNLGGLFLYPYSAVQGEDFRVVLMVWRGMNVVFGIGAILMLFLLVRSVFDSNLVGLLAACLFAMTPQFLELVTHVKPDLLELILVFLTLLICVWFFENYSYRLFLFASITGGLAFATKYGGAPFIVLVPGIAVYVIFRGKSVENNLAQIVKEQVRMFRLIFPLLCIAIGGALLWYAWMFYMHRFDGVSLVTELTASAFPPGRIGRVIAKLESWRSMIDPLSWGILGSLSVLTMTLVITRIFMRSSLLSVKNSISGNFYWVLLVIFMVQIASIYVVIFFITGPAYLVHPEHLASQFGWMVYYIILAGSYGSMPISFFESIPDAVAQMHGWWFFIPLALYALYVQLKDRTLTTIQRDRRMVLWSYILISLVIFISIRVGSLRFILPAIGLAYGFVGYAIVGALKSWPRTSAQKFTTSLVLMVLLSGFMAANVSETFERWEDKHLKTLDIGFEVGDWLRSHYDLRTRILKNKRIFYVPPEFANVSSISEFQSNNSVSNGNEYSIQEHVAIFDPEVVIVADLKDYQGGNGVNFPKLLNAAPIFQGKYYQMTKQFKSTRRGDRYENIRIYEKTVRPDHR